MINETPCDCLVELHLTINSFKNGAQDLRQCAGGVDTKLMNDWCVTSCVIHRYNIPVVLKSEFGG